MNSGKKAVFPEPVAPWENRFFYKGEKLTLFLREGRHPFGMPASYEKEIYLKKSCWLCLIIQYHPSVEDS